MDPSACLMRGIHAHNRPCGIITLEPGNGVGAVAYREHDADHILAGTLPCIHHGTLSYTRGHKGQWKENR